MIRDMENRTPIPLNILARKLRVSVGWLRSEAMAGRIPHLAAGRQILVDPPSVERVLAERAAAIPQEARHAVA